MNWAEKRIQEYGQGKKSTWIERRCLEHAQPFNLVAAIIATIMLGYGLWTNDWLWIGVGLGVGLLGHLPCWLKKS